MNVNNPPKMIVVVLALICLTVLLMSNTIDSAEGLGLIGLIVGYGVGNGIAAKQGDPVEPMIGRRTPRDLDPPNPPE